MCQTWVYQESQMRLQGLTAFPKMTDFVEVGGFWQLSGAEFGTCLVLDECYIFD